MKYKVLDTKSPIGTKLILLLDDEFNGVEYYYGVITPVFKDEYMNIDFDYFVVEHKEKITDENREAFIKIISDILDVLLCETVDDGMVNVNRANNS